MKRPNDARSTHACTRTTGSPEGEDVPRRLRPEQPGPRTNQTIPSELLNKS